LRNDNLYRANFLELMNW